MIEVGMRPWKDFVVLNVLFQDMTDTDMFSDLEVSRVERYVIHKWLRLGRQPRMYDPTMGVRNEQVFTW